MEFVAVFAFAVVVAMLYNFGAPLVAASSVGQKYGGSYAGKTLATAVVIFAAIVVTGLFFRAVDVDL
jgi:hypothetical protein